VTESDPKQRGADSASPQGTDTTASNSESENPALDAPTAKTDQRPRSNRDWWPNQVDLQVLNRTDPRPTRWARTSTTRRPSRRWTRGRQGRHRLGHAHVAGLVAG
jgi:hypothetical protein